MNLTKLQHGLLQVLAFAVSIATLATSVVSAKYQPLIIALVSAGQAALALANHGPSPASPAK